MRLLASFPVCKNWLGEAGILQRNLGDGQCLDGLTNKPNRDRVLSSSIDRTACLQASSVMADGKLTEGAQIWRRELVGAACGDCDSDERPHQ